MIWGGSSTCDHKWNYDHRTIRHGKSEASTIKSSDNEKHVEQVTEVTFGNCKLCNAFLGELGQEPHYQQFIKHLYQVFMELKRVLRDDGQLWINLGDTRYGSGGWGSGSLTSTKRNPTRARHNAFASVLTGNDYLNKCMLLIPTRFAEMMVDLGGWYLRNIVVWKSTNKMPESCNDRFSSKWEHFLFFTKKPQYYSNLDRVKIPSKSYPTDKRYQKKERKQYKGKSKETSRLILSPEMVNPGDVWTIKTANYKGAHYSTFPLELPEIPIKFSCPPNGGKVLDPFLGSGSTAIVAKKLGYNYTGIELNGEYVQQAIDRFNSKGNIRLVYGKDLRKLFHRRKR